MNVDVGLLFATHFKIGVFMPNNTGKNPKKWTQRKGEKTNIRHQTLLINGKIPSKLENKQV